MTGERDCAMIGANTILHLHEGTAMTGKDNLVTASSGYVNRLLSSL
jgi:hypothetical protein